MSSASIASVLLLAAAANTGLHAQAVPFPVGSPFPVTGLDFQSGSAVAMDSTGSFMVFFYEFFGGYEARGYQGPDGRPATPFRVFLEPYAPALSDDGFEAAALGLDDFLLVREDFGEEIWADRYSLDGTPLGSHLVVDVLPPGSSFGSLAYPAVAPWKLDLFVTVWVEFLGEDDPDGDDVLLRVMAVDGAAGPRFPVNTLRPGDQTTPEIAAGPDATFVVVWASEGSVGDDADGTSIQARFFFPPSGTPGPQFQLNEVTAGDQGRPDVAIGPNGRALVIWHGPAEPGAPVDSLRGRMLEPDGTPIGPELALGGGAQEPQGAGRVAALPDGGFQVAWNQGDALIFLQAIDSDGAPMGHPQRVDERAAVPPGAPALASRASGDSIVAWPPIGTAMGTVYARRYHRLLFVDGFETGDTSSWSSTSQ